MWSQYSRRRGSSCARFESGLKASLSLDDNFTQNCPKSVDKTEFPNAQFKKSVSPIVCGGCKSHAEFRRQIATNVSVEKNIHFSRESNISVCIGTIDVTFSRALSVRATKDRGQGDIGVIRAYFEIVAFTRRL